MKLTKDSRNLVLFMAIGDGYVRKTGGVLVIRHCVAQREYLEWKRDLLRKSGINTSDVYYVDNSGYGAYEFYTYSHKFIKLIRKYMYTPKKVIANPKLLKRLTPLGLYIWYLDNGGLSQIRDSRGNIKANNLMLNTMLTKEDNQIIVDYFWDTWGIKFWQAKNHGKYRLCCGTKEARKFLGIISKYKDEVNCLKYKFNVKPELKHT